MNIFSGLILDSYGYFMLEIFFIICLEIALLAAAFLYIYNSLKNGMLNDSPAVRRAKQELAKINSDISAEPSSTNGIKSLVNNPLSSDDDDDDRQAINT